MITWLHSAGDPLPDTRLALPAGSEAPGLLAAGGELTPQRLAEAYSKGVFPWYSAGQPVLWWSPDPRMVLWVAEFKLARSLRKTLARFARSPVCEVRIDSAFDQVINACASTPREGQAGTWIVSDMVQAYSRWHALGAVHSVETRIDGEHAGGCKQHMDKLGQQQADNLDGVTVDIVLDDHLHTQAGVPAQSAHQQAQQHRMPAVMQPLQHDRIVEGRQRQQRRDEPQAQRYQRHSSDTLRPPMSEPGLE